MKDHRCVSPDNETADGGRGAGHRLVGVKTCMKDCSEKGQRKHGQGRMCGMEHEKTVTMTEKRGRMASPRGRDAKASKRRFVSACQQHISASSEDQQYIVPSIIVNTATGSQPSHPAFLTVLRGPPEASLHVCVLLCDMGVLAPPPQ